MKFLKRVTSFYTKSYFYIWLLILINIVYIPIALFEPKIASKLTNIVTNNVDMYLIKRLSILFVCLLVIRLGLDIFRQSIALKIKLRVWKYVRQRLFNKLLRLEVTYFDTTPPGYILSRQVNDSEGIEGLLPDFLITVAASLIESILIFVFIFNIDWRLTFVTAILLISTFYVQFVFPLKKLYQEHNEARAIVSSFIQGQIDKINLIKANHRYKYHEKEYESIIDTYLSARRLRDKANIMRSNVSKAIAAMSYPITLLCGLVLISQNQINIGQLIAFTLYQSRLFSNITPLINAVPLITLANVSFKRIFAVLDLPEEKNGQRVVELNEQAVELKNIYFYDNENKILDNINLKVKLGESVALVGESGSGKSTIMKLLIGFYRPSEGDIHIHNISSSTLNLKDWRKNISYLSQKPVLFNKTLRYNLSYGNPNISDEDIIKLLLKLRLGEVLKRLPYGLDTTIEVDGSNFSGGEQQRLCLARELLRETSIILLDEATSALDKKTEIATLQTIQNYAKGKSCILITHRLELLSNVDKIIVLSKGKIIEVGSYNELNTPGKHFYDLNIKCVTERVK
ncbi:ABC transporter ATP-binding protein [Clostridium sp. 'deep sea']|uniref:ABC transporter ATP-binding protein n=1 Tax=Clostridium sp. 'deep sea' TaxID=2779445 RepID=UPI0018966076|nr:ABC transporter ATP-binding protein [Clostridium sp. 'deep sea']QOR36868.1 ABC transporter ATP-binding protein [Clostridium sp. 'deep sea']